MVDIFSPPQQCEKLIWTKSSQEWNRKYWPLRPPVISDLYPASWHACHWRRMMSDLKSHDLTGLSCGSWSLCSVMGMGDVLGGGEAYMFKTLVFYLFFNFFTYFLFIFWPKLAVGVLPFRVRTSPTLWSLIIHSGLPALMAFGFFWSASAVRVLMQTLMAAHLRRFTVLT